jgi:DNA-directed RNA polymerase subunit omega
MDKRRDNPENPYSKGFLSQKIACQRGVTLYVPPFPSRETSMRDDYLQDARKIIPDANVLINVVSKRVKQLRSTADHSTNPPKYHHFLGDVFEKLSPEDIALREIIEGKISWEFREEDRV